MEKGREDSLAFYDFPAKQLGTPQHGKSDRIDLCHDSALEIDRTQVCVRRILHLHELSVSPKL